MLIKPIIIPFNPERIMYKIKEYTIYAKKGHGIFEIKNGINNNKAILIKRAKELSIYREPINNGTKMMIEESGINCIYENGKDFIKTHNCQFKTLPKKPPKHNHIANVIYTNRP